MRYPNEFVCEFREYSTYINHVSAPVFRKSFRLEEGEKHAEILIILFIMTGMRLQRICKPVKM